MISSHKTSFNGMLLGLFLLCSLASNTEQRSTPESPSYVAAVVEFAAELHPEVDDPVQRIGANWVLYEHLIERAAADDADIIVFPECGLTTTSVPENRTSLRPFLSTVPDPKDGVSPCDLQVTGATQVVRNASCAARRHQLYLVMNLQEEANCTGQEHCPEDGFFIYNTNVAFDRNGMLVARYRKFHLFVEPGFDTTTSAELAAFDTDFGVRFGTFICFDVLFREPALSLVRDLQITDFAFSTAWFSELPFLTALQTHAGWAYALNVTMLASGVDRPSHGSTGSGIYAGRDGPLVAVMRRTEGTALLISRVAKRQPQVLPHSAVPSTSEPSASWVLAKPKKYNASYTDDLRFIQDDLHAFETRVLPVSGVFDFSLCQGDFCCRFDGQMESLNDTLSNQTYYYRAGAFDGVRNFGSLVAAGVQVCAVFSCLDAENVTSCGLVNDNYSQSFQFRKLNVSGDGFVATDSLQIPSTLQLDNLQPLKSEAFHYHVLNNVVTPGRRIELASLRPLPVSLFTFGVYSRVFSRDHPIVK